MHTFMLHLQAGPDTCGTKVKMIDILSQDMLWVQLSYKAYEHLARMLQSVGKFADVNQANHFDQV